MLVSTPPYSGSSLALWQAFEWSHSFPDIYVITVNGAHKGHFLLVLPFQQHVFFWRPQQFPFSLVLICYYVWNPFMSLPHCPIYNQFLTLDSVVLFIRSLAKVCNCACGTEFCLTKLKHTEHSTTHIATHYSKTSNEQHNRIHIHAMTPGKKATNQTTRGNLWLHVTGMCVYFYTFLKVFTF